MQPAKTDPSKRRIERLIAMYQRCSQIQASNDGKTFRLLEGAERKYIEMHRSSNMKNVCHTLTQTQAQPHKPAIFPPRKCS